MIKQLYTSRMWFESIIRFLFFKKKRISWREYKYYMAVLTMVQYHGFVVRLSLEYEFPCWKKIEQACCTIRTETICRPFFPTKATTCPVPKLKYLAQKRNTTLDNKAFLLAVFSISWNTPILPVPAAYILPARPVSSPVSFPVSLKMLFYIIPLCP